MVKLDGRRRVNFVAAHQEETVRALFAEAEKGAARATILLEEARASTPHSKIIGPGNQTYITPAEQGTDPKHTEDAFFGMGAPNPMAIEFGHFPSGVFEPSKFGKITKSPMGLYILTKASGLLDAGIALHHVSAGAKDKKNGSWRSRVKSKKATSKWKPRRKRKKK